MRNPAHETPGQIIKTMQMMWYHSQLSYEQVEIRKCLKPSQEIQKISYQKAVLSSLCLSVHLTCLSATTFLDVISSERLECLWRCLFATGFLKMVPTVHHFSVTVWFHTKHTLFRILTGSVITT